MTLALSLFEMHNGTIDIPNHGTSHELIEKDNEDKTNKEQIFSISNSIKGKYFQVFFVYNES